MRRFLHGMERNTKRGSDTLPKQIFSHQQLIVNAPIDNITYILNFSRALEAFTSTPVLAGLLAAGLALLGWLRIADETIFRMYQKERLNRSSRALELRKLKGKNLNSKGSEKLDVEHKSAGTSKQLLQIFSALISAFIITLLLTTSLQISVAISLLITGLPFILAKRKAERLRVERDQAWPIAIDEIVASLQAGLSITESVIALAEQGPPQLKGTFGRVRAGLRGGGDLETLLRIEMQILDSATADQTLSTLLFAKQFGGNEVTTTLRMLSTFLREEIKVREEIDTRFGWVRNSAVLGAVAPWLLLALLSTQRSTVEAYQTKAGAFILSLGVIFTAIAFLWMERVSRIPSPPRPLRPVTLR